MAMSVSVLSVVEPAHSEVKPQLVPVQCPKQPSLLTRRGGSGPSLAERRRGIPGKLPPIDCGLAQQEGVAKNALADPDCKSVSEHFELHEALGQGSTAVTYRATRHCNREQVALKISRVHDEELLLRAREEFELLRKVRHPNIIRAHELFTFSRGIVLVMDLFVGKTLDAAVKQYPGDHLTEAVVRHLFRALMDGIAHLHQSGIVHRDVKAANVLVSNDFSDLRLVDFNTATQAVEGGILTMTGTQDYLPPEVLRGEPHTAQSDVWAAGLCLYLMASGVRALERGMFASQEDFARAVVARAEAPLEGPRWEAVSDGCKEVVRQSLATDIRLRPTASSLLNSAWFELA